MTFDDDQIHALVLDLRSHGYEHFGLMKDAADVIEQLLGENARLYEILDSDDKEKSNEQLEKN